MSQRIVPIVCGGLTIALLLAFMHRDYPAVGLDFGQFVPRLVDTDIFIRINGYVPQLYTPSFGSGLPAFANPQHVQYSLIQLLLLVTGPWSAVLISTAIVGAIGFAAAYLFFRQTLALSVVASTLGAMSVVGNGFNIQHIAGGHVGFQLFPLLSVFVFATTSRRLSVLTASVLCGLAAAAVIHNGGALIAVLIGGTLILTLQVTDLLVPAAVNWHRAISVSAASGVIALSLAASKIYAVNAFMTHFPRLLSDRTDVGLGHAVFGLGSQLAGGMTIIPILFAGRFPTQRLDDALMRATGAGVHSPELDVSIQPVLLIALTVAIGRWLWLVWRDRTNARLQASPVAIVLLVLTTWIAIETALARGLIYPLLHKLPVFQSMHVNPRVAAVFVMPITVAAAIAIDRWRAHRQRWVGALLLSAALLFQASYELLPELFFWRWFDIDKIEQIHKRVRGGERFALTDLGDVPEDQVFETHTISRVPYEPLFGYNNEVFKAETREGPIATVSDGHFNVTNPASLLFPELNGLRTFERIRQDDAENLRRFINREQPQWKHPAVLDWLNALAIITLVFCVVVLLRAAVIR